MLKWQPGAGTPAAVHYNVTVNTDKGTSWVPVTGCSCVLQPLVCNLTDAFPDLRQVYFVQVTAWLDTRASRAATYGGFVPIKHTQLDLPGLTVTASGRNLCVDLQPPMEHLRQAYDTLWYKLRVESSTAGGAQFFKDTKSLRRQVLEDLAPGRQYCVSVCFSDSLESKESTYSDPVCAYTSGNYSADPWIAAVLCLFIVSCVVVFVLLAFTGFICLRRRPVPLVLTSLHHVDRVLVQVPCKVSLCSLLNVKVELPPAQDKRSVHSSSDESDEEAGTDQSRAGYMLRVGTGILSSSSSSSSSSLSAPLSPKLELQPSSSSGQMPDLFTPLQPEAQVPTEIHSTHKPSTDIHSLTVGPIQTDEEEEEHSQEVNLLTLTFGRHEEQEEAEEVNIAPGQPSQAWDDKEVATEAVFHTPDEEEEEEEQSGYMDRPCTDVLKNLL